MLTLEVGAWLVIAFGTLSMAFDRLEGTHLVVAFAIKLSVLILFTSIVMTSLHRWRQRRATWDTLDRHGREAGLSIDLVIGGSSPRDRLFVDTRRRIALTERAGACSLGHIAAIISTRLPHKSKTRRIWGYLSGWSDVGCDNLRHHTHVIYLVRENAPMGAWPKAEFHSAGTALWGEWQVKRLFNRPGTFWDKPSPRP